MKKISESAESGEWSGTKWLARRISKRVEIVLELISKVDTGRAGRDFALRRGVEVLRTAVA